MFAVLYVLAYSQHASSHMHALSQICAVLAVCIVVYAGWCSQPLQIFAETIGNQTSNDDDGKIVYYVRVQTGMQTCGHAHFYCPTRETQNMARGVTPGWCE